MGFLGGAGVVRHRLPPDYGRYCSVLMHMIINSAHYYVQLHYFLLYQYDIANDYDRAMTMQTNPSDTCAWGDCPTSPWQTLFHTSYRGRYVYKYNISRQKWAVLSFSDRFRGKYFNLVNNNNGLKFQRGGAARWHKPCLYEVPSLISFRNHRP